MHLCYVDESGTPEIPGNGRHYVLAGLSMPIWHWRQADVQINTIAARYGLSGTEIHTAWLVRGYLEQRQVPNFADLDWDARRQSVQRKRSEHLLNLQKSRNSKLLNQTKKNYKQSANYMHLTQEERVEFVVEIAYTIKSWSFASLFAECIDKFHFDSRRALRSVDEQAFEQVISRFERYLVRSASDPNVKGIVVHDNNQTVAKKHTDLMRRFHDQGTLWTGISRIIETPVFVDSKLTSMVQMADLCSYALRRYLDHNDAHLYNIVASRADRVGPRAVGVRHFCAPGSCSCDMCRNH